MDQVVSYEPSESERAVTLARGDFLKLSGDGVFATRQGEGITAGRQSIFLRLQNCNLSCGANGEGWPCDTWYTWDRTTPQYWQETSNRPVKDVSEEIVKSWIENFGGSRNPNLVISGGEPLLQQKKIIELLKNLKGWDVEIETNGTISPNDHLDECQINCSPKLESSGNSLEQRRKISVLTKITTMPKYWLKFVITEKDFDRDIKEVQDLVELSGASPERVLLMPEGNDTKTLTKQFEVLQSISQELGYKATQRLHVFWFGNKRGS